MENNVIIPRDYQVEAINSICTELTNSDRCNAIMACGTGKTFVSFWVCEKLKFNNILIIVPTITLVGQIIREWRSLLKEKKYEVNYMAVCSDDTVGSAFECSDNIIVSTDKFTIEKFMKKHSQISSFNFIFCTYSSSYIVGNASLSSGLFFDIIIYDEAHKTCGLSENEKLYAYTLNDSAINTKKRLFLTATPRVSGAKDHIHKNSMDDESLYGKTAYYLSFRDAINKEIICDYKILIPLINCEIDSNHISYANISSILKSIEHSGSNKILIFNDTIASSKKLVSEIENSKYLKNYKLAHIDGNMNIKTRNNIIEELFKFEKVIISNAKCFTEGVDIPSIDMVVFMNPKKSKVDIIQALGRCLRKSKDKKNGFILIPEFNIKESYGRFSYSYGVLTALCDNDYKLTDYLKKIYLSSKKDKDIDICDMINFTDSDSDSEYKYKIYDNYIKNISIISVDPFEEEWEKMLQEYKEYYNSGRGPRDLSNPLPNHLSLWADYNRTTIKKNTISTDRMKKLQEINFIVSPRERYFNKMVDEYISFYKENNISKEEIIKIKEKNEKLYHWIMKKISYYRKGKLPEEQKNILIKNGFNFDHKRRITNKFEEFLEKWIKYKNKEIKISEAERGRLASWASHQRMKARDGKIKNETHKKMIEEFLV